jgi:hypothetical protein
MAETASMSTYVVGGWVRIMIERIGINDTEGDFVNSFFVGTDNG